MVCEHPAADVVQVRAREHPGAELGVLAHLGPLGLVQRPGLLQHIVRHADLADVVQQPRESDALDMWRGQAEAIRDRLGVAPDGLRMRRRAVVAQVHRLGEHQHGGELLGRRRFDRALDLDLGAEDHGPVATEVLGDVQRPVGVVDEFVERRAMRRSRRDSEADRHHLALRPELLAHLAADAFSDDVGLVLVRGRQDHRELLAADPRRSVGLAHRGADERAELLQHRVALAVAEAVVDGLEVVEVADEEAERLVAAIGARELGGHQAFEAAAVPEAGERVGAGGLSEPLDEPLGALAQDIGQRADCADRAHRHDPAPDCRRVARGQRGENGGVRHADEREVTNGGGAGEKEEAVERDPQVQQRKRRHGRAREVDAGGDEQRPDAQAEGHPAVALRQRPREGHHRGALKHGERGQRGYRPLIGAGVDRQRDHRQREQAARDEQAAERAPANLVLAHALDGRRAQGGPTPRDGREGGQVGTRHVRIRTAADISAPVRLKLRPGTSD
ncbi:MAG TPA: hypothetical protein VFL73_08410 [Solirubrobacteraceae bacterium]|nr:hypothetical protein [Solirubrobacteraceae bacterium]